MENNKNDINDFLQGRDPMERIVSIECSYTDEKVSIIYNNKDGEKRIRQEDFKPFVWTKGEVGARMFGGDRKKLQSMMHSYGIRVKKLNVGTDTDNLHPRLKNGYQFLFYATKRMSYQKFMSFFQLAKTPIYPRKSKKDEATVKQTKDFLAISPVEQYMIYSRRRMFKGYESYDEVKRLIFDLETTGLNPKKDTIDQIGIRTNKGFEKIITITGEGEEKHKNELKAIEEFIQIIAEEKPDILAGHNSEKFDWFFIIVRCLELGTSLEEISEKYLRYPIYKKNKETVLKLGGEVEYYKPTIAWGFNIIDSLHAVRRAQAIDSSMKSANLKYVTQYLDLKKQNRVYVKGNKIGEIWLDQNPNAYAFNDTNGDYYKISSLEELKENYQPKSGRYIVERYLLDDLWETDKVELALNEANFLICKILPTTFQRACTMGTAGIWKLIMLGWSFENNLAIPSFSENQRFTGGLSRLLKCGYADRIVKLDYNSLYPSIMLTWNVQNPLDTSNSILQMLDYVLTNRELYKGLKAEFGGKAKQTKKQLENFNGNEDEKHKLQTEMQEYKGLAAKNDKKQLPLKILGNSIFGSYGAPNVFPHGFTLSAEKVTCIGRQSLRLMIYHFTQLGYTPIVGDSFTADTPLFIRYKDNGLIDIKPVSEIIDEQSINIDGLGREYDYSVKPYQVLCRSGWSDIKYVYRHKTDKPIYRITDGDTLVDVTEDHSLFNDKQEKIKPSEVTKDVKLEYYVKHITTTDVTINEKLLKIWVKMLSNGTLDRLPIQLLNCTNKALISKFLGQLDNISLTNKTYLAGVNFLKKKIHD